MATTVEVNGIDRNVDDDGAALIWVLREVLGTKFGGGMALCGACIVHVTVSPPALASLRSTKSAIPRSPRQRRSARHRLLPG
jgi:aerobic-type carbon monoxide dehydrogenase small subunit (CoxS/CutS family)